MQLFLFLIATLFPMVAAYGEESTANFEHYLFPNRALSFHYYEPGLAAMNVEFWGSLPANLPKDQFWKATRKTIDGNDVEAYIFSYPSYWDCETCSSWMIAYDPATGTYNFPFPETVQGRQFASSTHPTRVSIEQLSALIAEKSILIICGPGVASHAGILTRQAFIDAIEANGMPALIDRAEKALDLFVARSEAGNNNPPTPVHNAIAALAKRKNCMVLTSNFDMLLQKTGIPVEVVYSMTFDQSVLDKAFAQTELVLAIGLGTDPIGLLKRFKSLSPHGVIAAIDLAQPEYLGDEDLLLQGDLVEVVPSLWEQLN